MKVSKILAVVGVSLAVAVSAQAATKKKASHEESYTRTEKSEGHGSDRHGGLTHHKMAGCGLGSMVIQDSDKWMQVLAATLNGTGFQTIAMSFGTSNCTEDGVMQASREKEGFIEANAVELRRDLAVGNGEYLSSLASLYGCKGEAVKGFGQALHGSQDQVFQQSQSAEDSLRVMDKVLTKDVLASCQG